MKKVKYTFDDQLYTFKYVEEEDGQLMVEVYEGTARLSNNIGIKRVHSVDLPAEELKDIVDTIYWDESFYVDEFGGVHEREDD